MNLSEIDKNKTELHLVEIIQTLIKESKKQQVLFKKYYKVSEISRKVLEEKNPQKISEYQKQLDELNIPLN